MHKIIVDLRSSFEFIRIEYEFRDSIQFDTSLLKNGPYHDSHFREIETIMIRT
jgi:hypothetical protein